MKNASLLLVFLLTSLFAKAQITMGPLYQGHYYNEVVYVGTYNSPGTCTYNNGTDFTFSFGGLILPDGMEFVLVIDEPLPSNTAMMNGPLTVNIGDSTSFTPSTTGLGISAATNAATLNFHIRAIGTPTTVGQEYPCGIDGASSDAICGNSYALFPTTTPPPCYVSQTVGIEETEPVLFALTVNQSNLSITATERGVLTVLGIDGRVHFTKQIQEGLTLQGLSHLAKGNYIVRFDGPSGTKSQKIALQ